jgi:hypothetical protein
MPLTPIDNVAALVVIDMQKGLTLSASTGCPSLHIETALRESFLGLVRQPPPTTY